MKVLLAPSLLFVISLALITGCEPPGPGKLDPVAVVDHQPADGAQNVKNLTPIWVRFDQPLLLANVSFSIALSGTTELQEDNTKVVFTPATAYLRGQEYQVSFKVTPENPMVGSMEFKFTFTAEGSKAEDACEHSGDGTCDEPINCALGTDSSDCELACKLGVTPYLLGAACAYRDTLEPPLLPPSTAGSVHLTGHRMGTIDVPSGSDLTKKAARHYQLYIPPTYNANTPTPVVMMLPGHRVDIYSLADYTQLQSTADANGFILVYAEQEWRWDSFRWAWWTDWDWSGKPDNNPDVTFLEKLVERIGQEYRIDRTRIYAVGHSRGGAMALIAAFELGHLFAAACSQSGFTEFNYSQRIQNYTGRKVPLFFVHGVLDDDVCINCNNGGAMCSAKPGKPCGAGLVASDGLVEMLQEQGWAADALIYHRLENVTHRWQPWLNQAMWDFLKAHPLPAEELSP